MTVLVGSASRGRRGPPPSAFPHSTECRHPDIVPEWFTEPFSGKWERRCECGAIEYSYDQDERIDPNHAAFEPSWRAHLHGPSCEARDISVVVKVERREDGGWRSTCSVCTYQTIFWYDPARVDSRGRPITREGNVRYQYELKHQLVAV